MSFVLELFERSLGVSAEKNASKVINLPDGSKILSSCKDCCRCPLYQGDGECCFVGKAFNSHPNIQKLTLLTKEFLSENPQTLIEISRKVLGKAGTRMRFRGPTLLHAIRCVLYRSPEVAIHKNKLDSSEPLYSRIQN